MSNTGNTQQIIDYGATANDGTGDPLRTAFIKTDENFSNIWAAGPVGSNITIANNTIQNDSTNGNITLKPNGTGVIQANASILPSIDGVRDLGSANLAWRRAYIDIMQTQDLELTGNISVAGDAVIQGNLTVEGDTIQIGNITTDTLLIQLANAATTDAQANGAGVTVGANDDIATLLYDSANNTWATNIGLAVNGAITGTSMAVSDATIYGNIAAINGNFTGNIVANYFVGNGSLLTGMYGNANVVANLAALSSNPVSTTGNVAAGRLISSSSGKTWTVFGDRITSPDGGTWISDTINNDEYITSRPDGYINLQSLYANASIASEIHLEHGLINLRTLDGGTQEWTFDEAGNTTFPGNILPGANGVYSLGNSTNYWANLWVANNTIYIGGVPLGISAGNVLTVGGEPILSNDSNTSITTTGNITADYFFGNGSQLTGLNTNSISNGNSNVEIATADGNVTVTSAGTYSWTFDDTGNFALPNNGSIIVDGGDGVIGPVSDDMVISWDNEEIRLVSVQGSIEMQADNAFRVQTNYDGPNVMYGSRWEFSNNELVNISNDFGIISEAGNLTLSGGRDGVNSGNTTISAVNVGVAVSTWTFDNTGNLTLPSEGNIVGVTPNNAGRIQWVGNSSGDGFGYTTLGLVPDDTLVGNDQYLIIDPTAPGHIHIRAGGEQDNSAAELIIGGEYSHFKVGSGANATVYINANSHIWWFNQDGTVQLPPSDYGYAQFYTGGGANLYLGSSTYPVNITGADGSIIAPNNITANGNVTGDVGFFNDINLNNAGTNRMLYVDGDRNIYDTDFSYDAGNSSISGSGNITAGYFIGDGSQLTGLPAQYGNSNVATFLAAYGSNTISTSGNVTAGNFLGSGTNVDIIAGSYDWTFDNAGTLTLPGNTFAVNYANGTAVSLGGNYGNANVVANLAALSSNPVSTTGNVNSGNLLTSGTVSATGAVNAASITVTSTGTAVNASSGNMLTNQVTGTQFNFLNGIYTASINGAGATANYTLQLPANTGTNGQVLTTNGSGALTWSTPAGSYGNANVVANLAALSSNPISTTGNITANNFIGNVSLTGNIQGTSANVELVAGVYTWTFNNAGNLVLPGNTFSVNYANGTAVTLGGAGSYGNANVADFLDSLGSNAIITTGNITAGNLITSGAATTGVNALLAGPTFTPLANTSAGFVANVNSYSQITFQNKSTGADATADYILTADNGSDTVNYGDFGIINSGYDVNTPTNSLGNIVRAGDTYVYAQGNVSNTSQSGGNLILGTTTATKNVKIFAGGANNNALIANISNTGVAITGALSTTGNITANNITGSAANVTITANAYVWTFDNTGVATFPSVGGDEGGEINFGIPAANTTLTSPVKVDVYQDRIRFFDGSTKGAYIDLSQAATGVGTLLNNRVSTIAAANTAVTLNNIQARVGGSPTRLYVNTVSGNLTGAGTSQTMLSGSIAVASWINVPIGQGAANAFAMSGAISSNGDTVVLNLIDQGAGSGMWRITGMIANTSSNLYGVTIERLV